MDASRSTKLQAIAWKKIIDEYLSFAEEHSKKEGRGISIFKFLRVAKENGNNVDYYYGDYDSYIWKMLFEECPDTEKIQKVFDEDKMFMICVSIPFGDVQTLDSIRLFEYDTHNPIHYDD